MESWVHRRGRNWVGEVEEKGEQGGKVLEEGENEGLSRILTSVGFHLK